MHAAAPNRLGPPSSPAVDEFPGPRSGPGAIRNKAGLLAQVVRVQDIDPARALMLVAVPGIGRSPVAGAATGSCNRSVLLGEGVGGPRPVKDGKATGQVVQPERLG